MVVLFLDECQYDHHDEQTAIIEERILFKKITIMQKASDHIPNASGDDYTLWTVDISKEDYEALIAKYQDEGYSVRGAKEELLKGLSGLLSE